MLLNVKNDQFGSSSTRNLLIVKEDTLVTSYFLEDGGIRYRGAFMVREQPAVGGAILSTGGFIQLHSL